MLKRELRHSYKVLRNSLSPDYVLNSSISISNQLLQIPIWDFFYYHIFLSIQEKNEVDTSPLLSILQGKDKHIVLPKIAGETLENYLLTDNTRLQPNTWGVPEPQDGIAISEEKLDVVFVPLMAYDIAGNRVGYGKGFYDGLLKKCRPECIAIGLSFFEPEEELITDVREEDLPLNYCVTPKRIFKF